MYSHKLRNHLTVTCCSKMKTHAFLLFSFRHQTLHGVVFQHDNARPDAECHTTQFLTNNIIPILPCWPWLPKFPDIKPIKHISDELDRRVPGRVNTPANLHELFQALQQEGVAILAQVIHNLIQSVLNRC